jgi:hypothetical protein
VELRRILFLALVFPLLSLTGCSKGASAPAGAARLAFEAWVDVPYQNERFEVLEKSDVYALVRSVADFKVSPGANWEEYEASVECRLVGDEWRCDEEFAFSLTEEAASIRRTHIVQETRAQSTKNAEETRIQSTKIAVATETNSLLQGAIMIKSPDAVYQDGQILISYMVKNIGEQPHTVFPRFTFSAKCDNTGDKHRGKSYLEPGYPGYQEQRDENSVVVSPGESIAAVYSVESFGGYSTQRWLDLCRTFSAIDVEAEAPEIDGR